MCFELHRRRVTFLCISESPAARPHSPRSRPSAGPTLVSPGSGSLNVTYSNELPPHHLFGVPDSTLVMGIAGLPESRVVTHLHGGHTEEAYVSLGSFSASRAYGRCCSLALEPEFCQCRFESRSSRHTLSPPA